MNKNELIKAFEELGANDPESWAESEFAEGIPQLARFIFLKGCWETTVPVNDNSWIDGLVEQTPADSTEPFAGTAHALKRLLAAGADKDDIAEVVRGMQVQYMHSLCYQLDDPGCVEGNKHIDWALMQLDENGAAVRPINGLHESVLETDPNGREMRPE